MDCTSAAAARRNIENLSGPDLHAHQLARLNALLASILPKNRFYAEKLGGVKSLASLEDLAKLPFTFKNELVAAETSNGFAVNQTYPRNDYVRFHQTSGTRGRPLIVLDTPADWRWWLDCWQHTLDIAEVTSADRAVMAFSFGPFIGFWTAHDAVIERGCLVAPGGGMNTLARLELIRQSRATLVFCTPSYALHMAEAALARQQEVADFGVRCLILAGEPGGSAPTVRACIEKAWNARVVDHAGATEVGPWGFGARSGKGLHVLESEFIAEFISIEHAGPAAEGELAEMVLTALGRSGAPVIRYRTGDVVRPVRNHDEPCRFVLLEGGVVGRTDDMMVIRGVNVFPSAVEQILRSFPEITEFRLTAKTFEAMDQLRIEIEDRLYEPDRVTEELRLRLGLRIEVVCVPLGSLPRFEAKGRRFIDERTKR